MGIFEGRDKPKYVLCISFLQSGDVITGDSNGNLVVWGRGTNTILKLVKNVHEGPIFSLCVLKDGGVVSGGGKDGRLVYFDSGPVRIGVESQVRSVMSAISFIIFSTNTVTLPGDCIDCSVMSLYFFRMSQYEQAWTYDCPPE